MERETKYLRPRGRGKGRRLSLPFFSTGNTAHPRPHVHAQEYAHTGAQTIVGVSEGVADIDVAPDTMPRSGDARVDFTGQKQGRIPELLLSNGKNTAFDRFDLAADDRTLGLIPSARVSSSVCGWLGATQHRGPASRSKQQASCSTRLSRHSRRARLDMSQGTGCVGRSEPLCAGQEHDLANTVHHHPGPLHRPSSRYRQTMRGRTTGSVTHTQAGASAG